MSVTFVVLSKDMSTSFKYDNWTSVSPLHQAFPTLFSHCLATDITVAVGFTDGCLALPMRARLSPAVHSEFDCISIHLQSLCLGNDRNTRRLLWGACIEVRTRALYAMLKRSWCKLPFLDVNWDNFSPIKV